MSPKTEHHKTNQEDISFLYAAVHQNGDINYGWFFLNNCLNIAEAKTQGPIFVGGMITWLAYGLGLKNLCRQCPRVDDNHLLDLLALRSFHFLQGDDRETFFSWRVAGKHYCNLPNPRLTTINRDFSNWYFPPPDSSVPEPNPPSDPTPQPNTTHQAGSSGSNAGIGHFDFDQHLSNINQQLSRIDLHTSSTFDLVNTMRPTPDYLNYPYQPIQDGPTPHHGHPYHPPNTTFGYDGYTAGRQDPRGDPAYPHVPNPCAPGFSSDTSNWPLGYDGGWGPRGPPDHGNYPKYPNLLWPPYSDDLRFDSEGSTVDPTYNQSNRDDSPPWPHTHKDWFHYDGSWHHQPPPNPEGN